MHSPYTQKNIDKLLKKSIKKEITDNLLIPMAKNCDYTKKDIVDTVIFTISNSNFIEYGSKHLRDKKKKSPSSDTVFLSSQQTKQKEGCNQVIQTG